MEICKGEKKGTKLPKLVAGGIYTKDDEFYYIYSKYHKGLVSLRDGCAYSGDEINPFGANNVSPDWKRVNACLKIIDE